MEFYPRADLSGSPFFLELSDADLWDLVKTGRLIPFKETLQIEAWGTCSEPSWKRRPRRTRCRRGVLSCKHHKRYFVPFHAAEDGTSRAAIGRLRLDSYVVNDNHMPFQSVAYSEGLYSIVLDGKFIQTLRRVGIRQNKSFLGFPCKMLFKGHEGALNVGVNGFRSL